MAIIFGVGMFLCLRKGDIATPPHKKWRNIILLVGGFVYFMVLQGFFQFFASTVPAQDPGGEYDYFVVRIFTPTQEPENGRQRFQIETLKIYGPDGREEHVSMVDQLMDVGEGTVIYQKVCTDFGVPLTNWHSELLSHFETNGLKFIPARGAACQSSCEDDSCKEQCARACSNQRFMIYQRKEALR